MKGKFCDGRTVSFMNYDFGYLDLEEKTYSPLKIPSAKSVTRVSGKFCYLCLRAEHNSTWRAEWDSN